MSSWLLPDALADYDRTGGRAGVEYRFPFLDLRLVKVAWSTPTIPFRYFKFLVRRSMEGRLPRQILTRPKQPLAGDPLRCDWEALARRWSSMQDANGLFARFCSSSRRPGSDQVGVDQAYANLRFYELASWLRVRAVEG